MNNKMMFIVTDADLRGRQPSLITQACDWAKKKKIKFKLEEFKPGSLILFMNHKLDRFSLLAGAEKGLGTMVYHNHQMRLDLNTIEHIPEHFNGSKLMMDAATREMLETKLSKSKRNRLKGKARKKSTKAPLRARGARANGAGSSLALQ